MVIFSGKIKNLGRQLRSTYKKEKENILEKAPHDVAILTKIDKLQMFLCNFFETVNF